jgi:hypothetical protein
MCKQYNCKAKVFAKYTEALGKSIGSPDLMVLFTSTISHKMVKTALAKVPKDTVVVRSHSSSMAALSNILEVHAT